MAVLARIVVLALALAALAPAAATAQSSPFAPLPPPTPVQPAPAPQPRPSTPDTNGGLAKWQQVLIFGGGALLLGGIAFAIVRDARRSAPSDDDQRSHATTVTGSHKPQNKERARQKAKAARAARKRNAQRAKR